MSGKQSDLKKLAVLLEGLRAQPGGDAEGAICDARAFLDGNEDEGSIGCNLSDHPGLDAFRAVVASLAARPDVSAVKAFINEDMGDDEYPFVDTLFVCTAAPTKAIAAAFKPLSPDEVSETNDHFGAERLPPAPSGHRWVSVWWD